MPCPLNSVLFTKIFSLIQNMIFSEGVRLSNLKCILLFTSFFREISSSPLNIKFLKNMFIFKGSKNICMFDINTQLLHFFFHFCMKRSLHLLYVTFCSRYMSLLHFYALCHNLFKKSFEGNIETCFGITVQIVFEKGFDR